jgi:hypothetical protein
MRKYKSRKKHLVSFDIFGYLLQLKIESGVFIPKLAIKTSKNTKISQFCKNKKLFSGV